MTIATTTKYARKIYFKRWHQTIWFDNNLWSHIKHPFDHKSVWAVCYCRVRVHVCVFISLSPSLSHYLYATFEFHNYFSGIFLPGFFFFFALSACVVCVKRVRVRDDTMAIIPFMSLSVYVVFSSKSSLLSQFMRQFFCPCLLFNIHITHNIFDNCNPRTSIRRLGWFKMNGNSGRNSQIFEKIFNSKLRSLLGHTNTHALHM